MKYMNRHFTKEDNCEAKKHEKMLKCLLSLVIREVQIKTTLRYHFNDHWLEWRSLKNLETTYAGEDVEK